MKNKIKIRGRQYHWGNYSSSNNDEFYLSVRKGEHLCMPLYIISTHGRGQPDPSKIRTVLYQFGNGEPLATLFNKHGFDLNTRRRLLREFAHNHRRQATTLRKKTKCKH